MSWEGFQNRRGAAAQIPALASMLRPGAVASPIVWNGDDNLDLSELQQGFQETLIMEAQINKYLLACGGVRLVLMARR